MTADDNPRRLLVLGAGPAGSEAAATAASLGAEVVVAEAEVVGGAAHVWDCIPSKAMVASALRLDSLAGAATLGISATGGARPDLAAMAARADALSASVTGVTTDLLESQGTEIIRGRGRFVAPRRAAIATGGGTRSVDFDFALISTGSRPRVPPWAQVDGTRVLTTRDVYHMGEIPSHVIIVGSGVTGVEFVHVFASLGSEVTLLVSRQQVLPHRDPEVASVLEQDFLDRGVHLLKGSRAAAAERTEAGVVVATEDGRTLECSHVLLAVGSVPNSEDMGLEEAGVETDGGYVTVDEMQRTSTPHIYAAGDVTGQMPLSSVAAMQGRKIARHLMGFQVKPLDCGNAAQAIFTEPEIASVGLEEVAAAAQGHKVRITKVPFASNSRALIQGNPRGFVKVVSDPATHEVLGGTIVGHHASELIATLALAVQARLRVDVLVDTLMVYPSLTESLMEAAD